MAANKIAASGDYDNYMELKNIARKMYARGLLAPFTHSAAKNDDGAKKGDKDGAKDYPTLFASMGDRKATRIERELGVRTPHRYTRPEAVKQGVPNVLGLDIREAIKLLEDAGLTVGFTGTGMVVSQSLASGTSYTRGQRITLRLRNH